MMAGVLSILAAQKLSVNDCRVRDILRHGRKKLRAQLGTRLTNRLAHRYGAA
jgi:hypothetical protein